MKCVETDTLEMKQFGGYTSKITYKNTARFYFNILISC